MRRLPALVTGGFRIAGAWYKMKPEGTVPRALEALKGSG